MKSLEKTKTYIKMRKWSKESRVCGKSLKPRQERVSISSRANWFLTRKPRAFNGERVVFSTNDAEIIGYLAQKNGVEPLLHFP